MSERRHFVHLRENWYRDVWLLVISVVVLLTMFKTLGSATAIQAQRAQYLRDTCDQQNASHDRAKSIAARLPPDSRQLTVLFIDALVPRRDCQAIVAKATTGRG